MKTSKNIHSEVIRPGIPNRDGSLYELGYNGGFVKVKDKENWNQKSRRLRQEARKAQANTTK